MWANERVNDEGKIDPRKEFERNNEIFNFIHLPRKETSSVNEESFHVARQLRCRNFFIRGKVSFRGPAANYRFGCLEYINLPLSPLQFVTFATQRKLDTFLNKTLLIK